MKHQLAIEKGEIGWLQPVHPGGGALCKRFPVLVAERPLMCRIEYTLEAECLGHGMQMYATELTARPIASWNNVGAELRNTGSVVRYWAILSMSSFLVVEIREGRQL